MKNLCFEPGLPIRKRPPTQKAFRIKKLFESTRPNPDKTFLNQKSCSGSKSFSNQKVFGIKWAKLKKNLSGFWTNQKSFSKQKFEQLSKSPQLKKYDFISERTVFHLGVKPTFLIIYHYPLFVVYQLTIASVPFFLISFYGGGVNGVPVKLLLKR